MNTQTAAANNKGVVKEAFEAAVDMAGAALDVDRLKRRVGDAVYDAERIAKHGKASMEDALEDTTHYIKKNPWLSVGYVLGAGVGVGFLTGWLFGRGGSCKN